MQQRDQSDSQDQSGHRVIQCFSLCAMLLIGSCAAMLVHANYPPPLATLAKSGLDSQFISTLNHQLVQVSQHRVSVDGRAAMLSRYERRDRRNSGLEGEHLSILIDSNGRLLGFANIALEPVAKPLPSAQRSEQIARGFLKHAAADLLPHMQISSIREYRHPIRLSSAAGSQTQQLSGMWIKARNTQDGSWFWVIVDGNQRPMIFERDVQWSNVRFRRTTEHWLSDTWLKSQ